jgi:type I restriction enzyme S subunit
MKTNWQIKKLGNICDIQTGKWDANHAIKNGKYRFYTCAYEHGFCNTKKFSGECLILPGNGVNVGEVFYYQGNFDAYQRTYVVNNIQIFPKFLYYHLFCFWKERNLNKQFGSATNFLKIGNLSNYEISCHFEVDV